MKIANITNATKEQLIKEAKRLGIPISSCYNHREDLIAKICYKRGFNDCKSNPDFNKTYIEREQEEKTTLLIDESVVFEMTKKQAEAVKKVCNELGIFYGHYVPHKFIKI